MTTPETVLLTQIPIAIACFWVAFEIRSLRRSLDRRLDKPSDDSRQDG